MKIGDTARKEFNPHSVALLPQAKTDTEFQVEVYRHHVDPHAGENAPHRCDQRADTSQFSMTQMQRHSAHCG